MTGLRGIVLEIESFYPWVLRWVQYLVFFVVVSFLLQRWEALFKDEVFWQWIVR